MKKTLYDFKETIEQLPVKDKYTKEEVLIPELRLEQEGEMEVYYAPHNEYINPDARIFIIGITPGFQQMSTAIVAARKGLAKGIAIEDIQHACKYAARFSGVIRNNIIEMMNLLQIPEKLGIKDCADLFGKNEQYLHTVSIIPYSVFVKKNNYSGHTPKIMKSDLLRKYIYENFVPEYDQLNNKEKVLLIPLGRAVEEILLLLAEESYLRKEQILKHFPHPSGANVNRIAQFEEHKEEMMEFLQKFFEDESI